MNAKLLWHSIRSYSLFNLLFLVFFFLLYAAFVMISQAESKIKKEVNISNTSMKRGADTKEANAIMRRI